MKFRALLIAAAVSAGLAGLAGCDRNEPTRQAAPPPSTAPERATAPTPPSDRATAPGDSARTVGQTLDDAGITAKVKTALLAEKGVNGTSINVDTMQGRVTLTGRVPDQAQVDRAAQVASSVEGVKAVENKLTAGG
jgi:hyperosmotically inducible protein